MIKRIHRQAIVILAIVSAVSAFAGSGKLSISILIGGLLALFNFSGLARGLETMLGTHKPALRLTLLGIFRLIIVSAIIIVLAAGRMVDLVGLAGGFTVVLVLLVVEGLRTARKDNGPEDKSVI
jgi:hypothetical protein